MNKKVLFWDFDGTLGYRMGGMWSSALLEALLETDPACKATLDDFIPLLQKGFPWHHPDVEHTKVNTPERWWSNLRKSVIEKAYRSLGYCEKQAQQLALLAQKKYVDVTRWSLYDDVIPILDVLKKQGWTQAIVSNHVPELNDILTHLGLSGYISEMINSAFVGYEKPHPQIYKIAMEKMGNPSVVWMIGDNIQADVLGAERVGMKGILVRKEDHRAVRQSKNLYDIPSIVNTWK
jgi:putative hydrolase of the HAD superfamily